MSNKEDKILLYNEVFAEDSHKYPDMVLRLLLRKAVIDITGRNELTIDEALRILEDEHTYLKARLDNAL